VAFPQTQLNWKKKNSVTNAAKLIKSATSVGAFRNLWSACPSVRRYVRNNAGATEHIFGEMWYWRVLINVIVKMGQNLTVSLYENTSVSALAVIDIYRARNVCNRNCTRNRNSELLSYLLLYKNHASRAIYFMYNSFCRLQFDVYTVCFHKSSMFQFNALKETCFIISNTYCSNLQPLCTYWCRSEWPHCLG
jgi:hypothetical protein